MTDLTWKEDTLSNRFEKQKRVNKRGRFDK